MMNNEMKKAMVIGIGSAMFSAAVGTTVMKATDNKIAANVSAAAAMYIGLTRGEQFIKNAIKFVKDKTDKTTYEVPGDEPEMNLSMDDGTEETPRPVDLPDDSGEYAYHADLPDDSREKQYKAELPDDGSEPVAQG